MAGGGVKGGVVHGETDEFSYNIINGPRLRSELRGVETKVEQVSVWIDSKSDPLEQAQVSKERAMSPVRRDEESGVEVERLSRVCHEGYWSSH
jgi:hypothetical protein